MKTQAKKVLSAICILFLSATLFGCEDPAINTADNKLIITATLFPQYDFARQIAGGLADVTLLLPPGVDCHSYDPSPADIIKTGESDLFIYTGDDMEPWAAKLISGGEIKGVTLSVCEGLNVIDDHEHSHDIDPHVWTNPVNAVAIVQNICDALCSLDAENSDVYIKNTTEYIEKLLNLDVRFEQAVKNSRLNKMVFGGQFALHYFEKRYGLTHIAAFDSCNSKTEPAARVVADIIEQVRAEEITVIFHEELSDTKVARAISGETGSELLLFHSCHNLSQEEFNSGETYLSLMEQNLINLKEGLS